MGVCSLAACHPSVPRPYVPRARDVGFLGHSKGVVCGELRQEGAKLLSHGRAQQPSASLLPVSSGDSRGKGGAAASAEQSEHGLGCFFPLYSQFPTMTFSSQRGSPCQDLNSRAQRPVNSGTADSQRRFSHHDSPGGSLCPSGMEHLHLFTPLTLLSA